MNLGYLRAGLVALGLSAGALACDSDEAPPVDDLQTFVIPFAPVWGEAPIECGRTYTEAGVGSADFELKDLLLFVHRVELVRDGGEVVPLQLVDDQQWQGQGVALLDFGDATGACIGDPETNRRVIGRAPPRDDYVGLRFGVGLPPALNHLDATTAPAPFNKPSTWWTWQGGYRFFQMSVVTATHPDYYVHIGSTNCSGDPASGFSCAFDHPLSVALAGFVPGEDGVRINIARLLSEVDIEAPVDFDGGDFIAGCMSFAGDGECEPIYTKFGRHFMDDGPAPTQIVFERAAGEGATLDGQLDVEAVPQPGNPDFERHPALDAPRVSAEGVSLSHIAGDTYTIGSHVYARGPGSQCVHCHQENGPGIGRFEMAGTVFMPDRVTPLAGAVVKVLPLDAGPCGFGDQRAHCVDQAPGFFREADVVAELVSDPNGNFYTTDLPADVALPFWPVVVPPAGSEGMAPRWMGHPTGSAACNMCHGSNLRIELGAE